MLEGLPWQAICDQASGPVAVLDLQGRYIYVNPAFSGLTGYDFSDMFGCTPTDFTYPGDPVIDRDVIDKMIDNRGQGFSVQKRFLRANGGVIWVQVNGSIIRNTDSEPLFCLAQMQDVTAQHEAELLWHRTLINAPIGMAVLDLDGYWQEVNDKLCKIIGYRRAELLTMHFADLTYPEDRAQGDDQLSDLADGRREAVTLEKRYRHKDGHVFWMSIRATVVEGPDGQPAFVISQYEVIGNSRMSDAHLAHLALHDPLTGLANRALLNDRLEHELASLGGRGGLVAVVLADLDRLKEVNDKYGHGAGDQFLTTAAKQLLSAVGPDDTAARIGGDEFVVLTHAADRPGGEAFRDQVANCLRTDIVTAGRRLHLSASAGLATTDDPSSPAAALLHRADRDMYAHKRQGR